MKEDFLHYIWQYKLFDFKSLKTAANLSLEISKFGTHNKNAGPDFLNAKLSIDNQIWFGNVEIHLKSSDWYVHHHEKDKNYDNVILHVVWEHDVDVFNSNNQPIPTLVLKDLVHKEVIESHNNLLISKPNWIPCEKQIKVIEDFTIQNWLERLYFERLEEKSLLIKDLLLASNNDFEAVLFQLIAKNFGLKINGDAFLKLATSLDFSTIRKVRSDTNQLMALFFGQAGFLEETADETYIKELTKEYKYLQHKYKLQPISKNNFQFFRMRPNNFPTIRIAQLTALIHQKENLFSKIINIKNKQDFYDIFSITVDEFWKTHYVFDKVSKKTSKKLTKSFLDLLMINTILPFQFVYQQYQDKINQEALLHLIKSIKAEKNSIIDNFKKLGVVSDSAFHSQALLQLKNNYCASKRCLECAIGNKILKY